MSAEVRVLHSFTIEAFCHRLERAKGNRCHGRIGPGRKVVNYGLFTSRDANLGIVEGYICFRDKFVFGFKCMPSRKAGIHQINVFPVGPGFDNSFSSERCTDIAEKMLLNAIESVKPRLNPRTPKGLDGFYFQLTQQGREVGSNGRATLLRAEEQGFIHHVIHEKALELKISMYERIKKRS